MRSILIATERTSADDPTVSCGLALAQALRLPARVVHVLTSAPTPQEGEQIERAVAHWADIGATPVIRQAAPGDEDKAIIEQASEASAEIIVLGRHRHALIRDLFGKSMVEDVMEDTDRKILVAAPSERHSFARVLVATDLSEPSWHALATASRLFPRARLDLVHAWHVPFEAFLRSEQSHDELAAEAEAQMRAFLSHASRTGISLGSSLIREGETVSVVSQTLAELGSDLLVIANDGRGGIFTSPFGTTARAFLEDPPCNVLAVQSGPNSGGLRRPTAAAGRKRDRAGAERVLPRPSC